MGGDRYGNDVLAGDWRMPVGGRAEPVDCALGLIVEDVETGWCGEVVTIDRDLGTFVLEDRRLRRRAFSFGAGFLIDGKPTILTAPRPGQPAAPTAARTASGSVAVPGSRARVARASRIFVEGRHDAELVEKVWGDDLRLEGVVVEYLGGIDDLESTLHDFEPGPGRRVGVLVDHLIPGSKEQRIADRIAASRWGPYVLVAGHPYVDVWAAVKPARLGLKQWPEVPRDEEWKKGVCFRLGWPFQNQADIARAWQHILQQVQTYADLEPSLLGRVEELIDFVTAE